MQTLNYTLMYEVSFLPTENGTDVVNATATLRVDSLCTKVSISNVTLPKSYFVRTTEVTITIPLFTPSWPNPSIYNETQLYGLCGEPRYFLHSDKAENSSYDNLFTYFSWGARTAPVPANVITLKYFTSDTLKAGGLDANNQRKTQTTITAYVMG